MFHKLAIRLRKQGYCAERPLFVFRGRLTFSSSFMQRAMFYQDRIYVLLISNLVFLGQANF